MDALLEALGPLVVLPEGFQLPLELSRCCHWPPSFLYTLPFLSAYTLLAVPAALGVRVAPVDGCAFGPVPAWPVDGRVEGRAPAAAPPDGCVDGRAPAWAPPDGRVAGRGCELVTPCRPPP